MGETSKLVVVRVWDLPTRLFHWALVALVVASFVTGKLGELDWHFRSGCAVLALLLFRLVWGLVGSDTARFSQFLRGPGAVWRYVRGGGSAASVGHNPLGGWAVAALLLLLCAQVGTGLFADDDISFQGPLAQFVDHHSSRVLTGLHHRSVNVLLALVALHVGAIGFYWVFRRRNLVWPMVTGTDAVAPWVGAPRMRGVWVAGVVFLVACGVGVWVWGLGD